MCAIFYYLPFSLFINRNPSFLGFLDPAVFHPPHSCDSSTRQCMHRFANIMNILFTPPVPEKVSPELPGRQGEKMHLIMNYFATTNSHHLV